MNEALENRVMRLNINFEAFITFLDWLKNPAGNRIEIEVPDPKWLPKDARIKNMAFDYAAHSVSILLEHESFEEVPIGCEAPRIPAGAKIVLKQDDSIVLVPEQSDQVAVDWFQKTMRS